MSKSGKQPLDNAAEIIEKFGGIRPMASKTGVAVTTVQGWKKRGSIPAARKDPILAKAAEHEIDLYGLVDGAPAPELESAPKAVLESSEDALKSSEIKEKEEEKDDVKEDVKEENTEEADNVDVDGLEIPESLKRTVEAESVSKKENVFVEQSVRAQRPGSLSDDEDEDDDKVSSLDAGSYTQAVLETKKGAGMRSLVIALAVFLLIFAVLLGLVIPKHHDTVGHEDKNARVESLEEELSVLKQDKSGFKGLVPENWSEELEHLKTQVVEAKKGVGRAVDGAKKLSHDLTTEEGLRNRVAQLQTYVSEISGDTGVYALKSRFSQMRQDVMGEKVLNSSVQALLPLVQKTKGYKTPDQLNALIAQARTKSTSLQASLGDVPQNELKAAAMLLAMTQVRSALNRPETAFNSDLGLLLNMLGDDNTALLAALEKLAPYSRDGVLTPAGVGKEFQSVAGEAVAASLRGEDVSVSEKLSAKFNELLQVEKDGELLTGTKTQETVNTVDKMVQKQNYKEAIKFLKKNLRSKELEPLRPWIRKAEALMASRRVNAMIEEAIELNFGSSGLLGGNVLAE